MRIEIGNVWHTVGTDPVNSLTNLNPEVWAQEALMVVENNTVMAHLVHTDYSEEVADFGATVHTHKPGTFEGKRKTDDNEVIIQGADTSGVDVKLDQHLHVSFLIKDGQASKSFKDLVALFLRPALVAQAQILDEVIIGEKYNFLGNIVGKLGTSATKQTLIDTETAMDELSIPGGAENRRFIMDSVTKGNLLGVSEFTNAEKVADGGAAVRQGELGVLFGMDNIYTQNCKRIASTNSTTTTAINLTAGYAAGSTALVVDAYTGADPTAGDWCTIAGDMIPQRVISYVASTGVLTVSPGLESAVVNNAVVTNYTSGAINLSAGYAADYLLPMVTDTFSVAPQKGQLISMGTAAGVYGAINTPTTTEITLNRALAAAVSNNDLVGIGPAGSYNFAFHKNAIALVSRPLVQPMTGAGAVSAVVQNGPFSVRVTITYDGRKQGHLVTVDFLCGVKTLDANLGVIALG